MWQLASRSGLSNVMGIVISRRAAEPHCYCVNRRSPRVVIKMKFNKLQTTLIKENVMKKDNIESLSDQILFVGIDVHKKNANQGG